LLACANLDDLYSAVGGSSIRLAELEQSLDEVGISRDELAWTTINILGPNQTNRPGVLASLAGLVSEAGGNIIRTVNDTFADGGFSLRLVLSGMDEESKKKLLDLIRSSDITLSKVEIV